MARLITLTLLVATMEGCTTYHVQQSSLVPAATLPAAPSPGGLVDLYLEDSTVTFLATPEQAPNSEAGLYIPRHQFQAAATFHFNEYFAFRMLGRQGLSAGAMKAAPTTLIKPGEDVRGLGQGWLASIPLSGERHRLHITADMLFMSVPSYVIAECVSGCDGVVQTRRGPQTDGVLQSSIAFAYAYRATSNVELIVTTALQTHPTNIRDFSNYAPVAEVESGPAYVIAGLGAEIHLKPYLSLLPQLSWPISRDPVVYGPVFGLGLRASVPRPTPAGADLQ